MQIVGWNPSPDGLRMGILSNLREFIRGAPLPRTNCPSVLRLVVSLLLTSSVSLGGLVGIGVLGKESGDSSRNYGIKKGEKLMRLER